MVRILTFLMLFPRAIFAEPTIDLSRVSSALTGDFFNTGAVHTFLLLDTETSVDLYIFDRSNSGDEAMLIIENFAWRGPGSGSNSQIGFNEAGAFFMNVSDDTLETRNWNLTITLDYMQGRFVIKELGIQSMKQDRLPMRYDCHVWLLDGTYQIYSEEFSSGKKSGAFEPRILELADWEGMTLNQLEMCEPWENW